MREAPSLALAPSGFLPPAAKPYRQIRTPPFTPPPDKKGGISRQNHDSERSYLGSLPSHAEKWRWPARIGTGFRRSASGLRRLDGNVHPKPAAEITFSIAGGLIISVVLCQLGPDIVAERFGRSVAGHTGSLKPNR